MIGMCLSIIFFWNVAPVGNTRPTGAIIMLHLLAGKATLAIPLVVELGLESNHTAVLIKSYKVVGVEVDDVLQNLHLDRARGIAIAKTTRDRVQVVLNLGVILQCVSPPWLSCDSPFLYDTGSHCKKKINDPQTFLLASATNILYIVLKCLGFLK